MEFAGVKGMQSEVMRHSEFQAVDKNWGDIDRRSAVHRADGHDRIGST
jgi:hypothetical protein